MPITDLQRQQRRSHLGSSDMAAILGLEPERNALDVFLEKKGLIKEIEPNDAMKLGIALEPGVLTLAEEKLGKLKRNQYRSAEGFPLGSNIDAIVVSSGEPVEAKTSGIRWGTKENWGEEGSDDLPHRILVQCLCHMICTNKKVCHVPAVVGGKGFVMYKVKWDEKVAGEIMDKSLDFWENYIEKDKEPPDVMPSLITSKRRIRIPKKTVKIEPILVVHWQNAKESLKLAKEIKESAEAEMLAALGDAEGGECDLGLLTYLEQCRRTVKARELKDAYPDIYAQFENVSTFRVARLKKPKKPKGFPI